MIKINNKTVSECVHYNLEVFRTAMVLGGVSPETVMFIDTDGENIVIRCQFCKGSIASLKNGNPKSNIVDVDLNKYA